MHNLRALPIEAQHDIAILVNNSIYLHLDRSCWRLWHRWSRICNGTTLLDITDINRTWSGRRSSVIQGASLHRRPFGRCCRSWLWLLRMWLWLKLLLWLNWCWLWLRRLTAVQKVCNLWIELYNKWYFFYLTTVSKATYSLLDQWVKTLGLHTDTFCTSQASMVQRCSPGDWRIWAHPWHHKEPEPGVAHWELVASSSEQAMIPSGGPYLWKTNSVNLCHYWWLTQTGPSSQFRLAYSHTSVNCWPFSRASLSNFEVFPTLVQSN